jgi:hypothetical protein
VGELVGTGLVVLVVLVVLVLVLDTGVVVVVVVAGSASASGSSASVSGAEVASVVDGDVATDPLSERGGVTTVASSTPAIAESSLNSVGKHWPCRDVE